MKENEAHPSLPSTLYTEDYFLRACEGYEEWLASEGEHLSRRLSSAFAVAAVEPGMRVLDIGCGRGEIIRHCAQLGADVYGIDYAAAAAQMSRQLISQTTGVSGKMTILRSDAKRLPFPQDTFDRVLMFDVVEHLYPWELHQAILEVHRVLKPDGRFIIHTAPNHWYDRYAYPAVRLVRTLMGQGKHYPKNPRQFGVEVNEDVHVNEQNILSLRRALVRAGFDSKIWLDTPPQNRDEGLLLAALRKIAFNWIPFRWFFERELFAVARKA